MVLHKQQQHTKYLAVNERAGLISRSHVYLPYCRMWQGHRPIEIDQRPLPLISVTWLKYQKRPYFSNMCQSNKQFSIWTMNIFYFLRMHYFNVFEKTNWCYVINAAHETRSYHLCVWSKIIVIIYCPERQLSLSCVLLNKWICSTLHNTSWKKCSLLIQFNDHKILGP